MGGQFLSDGSKGRVTRRSYRARRIGTTFGRVYLGIRAHRLLARRFPRKDEAQRWSELHETCANSIYSTAIELRGMILKGCQFLGTRADILPREYVDVLSRLQDRVPPHSFDVVRRTVEHELGCELDDVFPSFSRAPVASASLAQVHDARLRDGRRVAVKVQYPEIEKLVKGDLANLETLFRSVRWLEPDFDLMPLIEELGDLVPRELNFLAEATNAETIGEFFEGHDEIGVPRIHWEHTTRRVLTMEYIDGIKITDLDGLQAAAVDVRWASRTLAIAYCEQILRHGFFNADPHPGNILIEPRADGPPRLVLLDFGLAKELPPHFRRGVLSFATAVMRRDASDMASSLLELGFETRDGSAESLKDIADYILDLSERFRDRSGEQMGFAERMGELPGHIRENPIVRVPTHLVLLGRVLALLSGVNRSLGAKLDLPSLILPYAL